MPTNKVFPVEVIRIVCLSPGIVGALPALAGASARRPRGSAHARRREADPRLSTRVRAGSKRREESRRGRHECPRHVSLENKLRRHLQLPRIAGA